MKQKEEIIERKIKRNEKTKSDAGSRFKVVDSSKKGIQLCFEEYIRTPKILEDFTTLKKLSGISKDQLMALEKIHEYWLRRIRNEDNWQTSKHWSERKESISSRIDHVLFQKLKTNPNNLNTIIKNFIRTFLRDPVFRKKVMKTHREQSKQDLDSIRQFKVGQGKEIDTTQFYKELQAQFGKVVSGVIRTQEKELFIYYCHYHTWSSISYLVRTGLLHHADLPDQARIQRWEVHEIMRSFIEEREEEKENAC